MLHSFAEFASPIAAYLLGSIPFAFMIGKAKGVDLRTVGSGNPGAGNLTRTVGKGWGIVAAVLDGLKGLFPVLWGRSTGVSAGILALLGLAAVAGHNWSVFLRFRGGRGLAASVGVVLGLAPALLIWPGGWAVAGWKVGGGMGGFIGWVFLPLVALSYAPAPATLVCTGLAALMLIRRMQGNAGRNPGLQAALYRAVFDREPAVEKEPSSAEEPVRP